MLGLLALALALRVYGIHFGLPALNDPDELMFELGAVRMLSGGTLNPGWFGHPATTTMYVLAIVDVLVVATGWLVGWFSSIGQFADAIYGDPSWVILPGRVAMALFGAGCVYLTWRLGRDLWGKAAGLVAAALLAVNPVHITWSQVIRSDIMATFFLLLCLIAALRIAREGRWRDHVLAALWLGLAIATKWPFAIGGFAIMGAGMLRFIETQDAARRVLLRTSACLALSVVFLLIISPYLLLDHERVLLNLHGEAQVRHLGATGSGPLDNAWWYLSGPLLTGMGAAGLLLSAAGAVIARRQREALVVIVPVLVAFFLLICAQRLVWDRWVLPLMPLLAILAGAAAVWLWRLGRQRLNPPVLNALSVIALAALLAPLLAQTRTDSAERLDDTRQQAAHWARIHIRPGSNVLIEHFAFDMLPQPVGLLFPIGESGCVDVRQLLRGKTSYTPIENARGGRSNIDYGTLPPAKRNTCKVDYAILAHFDRYHKERRDFPAEYASYRELLGRGRIVASFVPRPGISGGPVVRILKIDRQAD